MGTRFQRYGVQRLRGTVLRVRPDFSPILNILILDFSQHDESSDFSQIEVILETEDGKFVEKTLCSQNGFYLLPIYDRKSYVIRVKPIKESKFGMFSPFSAVNNRTVEPERIAINLIDKSYDEIKKITEKVHNFKFVGFTLANKVITVGRLASNLSKSLLGAIETIHHWPCRR